MTDKISIKDKTAVQARIGELNTHEQSVTSLGNKAKSRVTALTAALGITADGSAPAEPVSGGAGTTAQGHTDTATGKLSSASSKLQSWLGGLETIDTEGATGVQSASGTANAGVGASGSTGPSTPTPTTSQAKPYSTSGGTTGGVSPYPAK